MSGILTIDQGSPHWWLSPDIWVTLPSDSTPVTNPIAGQAYNVWVQVHDNYADPVDSGWNLLVCWAIPTLGGIPVTTTASGQTISNGQILSNAAISVPVPAMSAVSLTTNWTPSYENGGHECLIAMAYNEQATGFPVSTLNGHAPSTDTYSIAQHNLGVVQIGSGMNWRFHYPFQVSNGADLEPGFVIEAREAPISEIAAFLPGLRDRTKVSEKLGKVERLGILDPHQPDPIELEDAPAILSHLKIAPRSSRPFALTGRLERGNALIHVTQSLDGRVVGGLSLLVMAEEK